MLNDINEIKEGTLEAVMKASVWVSMVRIAARKTVASVPPSNISRLRVTNNVTNSTALVCIISDVMVVLWQVVQPLFVNKQYNHGLYNEGYGNDLNNK